MAATFGTDRVRHAPMVIGGARSDKLAEFRPCMACACDPARARTAVSDATPGRVGSPIGEDGVCDRCAPRLIAQGGSRARGQDLRS